MIMLCTYIIQPPSRQNSLCRSGHTTPIPLQIPHDLPPTQLGKHLCNLLNVRRIDPWTGATGQSSTGVSIPTIAGTREEPSDDEEGDDCEGEEGGDVERRFRFGHVERVRGWTVSGGFQKTVEEIWSDRY